MPLKATVETAEFEALPEAVREFYKENSGKYVLDAEGIEDVSGLKSALSKEKEARRTASEQLQKLQGVDPEEYQRLKTESEERANSKLKAEGKFDELKGKWDEQKKTELDTRDKKIQDLETRLRRFTLEDKIRGSALKAGVIPEDLDDVITLTSPRFSLDDKERIQVLDDDGDPMDVTVDKFFTDIFKEKKPKFYAASGAAGSGAPSNANGGGGSGAVRLSKAEARNSTTYQQAKALAEKRGVELVLTD